MASSSRTWKLENADGAMVESVDGVVTINDAAMKVFNYAGVNPFGAAPITATFGYTPLNGTDHTAAYFNAVSTIPGMKVTMGNAPTVTVPKNDDLVFIDQEGEPADTGPGTKLLPASYVPDYFQDGSVEPNSGGMIALVPNAESAANMVVLGGEHPLELHLTLAYLGNGIGFSMPEDKKDILRAFCGSIAANYDGPIQTECVGAGVLGPSASVYIIGDSEQLGYIQNDVAKMLTNLNMGDMVSIEAEQRKPWIPHVTGAYDFPASALVYRGPVVFDRLRITFGEVITDFVLGENTITIASRDVAMPEWAVSGAQVAADNPVPPQMTDDKKEAPDNTEAALRAFHLLTDDQKIAKDAYSVKDGQASSDPNATRLRIYWTKGPGAAKIRWGEPGDFKRAVSHLRKFVGARAEGLAAIYHHVALGVWPGREHGKSLDMAVWESPSMVAYTKLAFDADTIYSMNTTEGDML